MTDDTRKPVYSLEAHNSLKRRFMVGGYEVEVWSPGTGTPDNDEVVEVVDALRDALVSGEIEGAGYE